MPTPEGPPAVDRWNRPGITGISTNAMATDLYRLGRDGGICPARENIRPTNHMRGTSHTAAWQCGHEAVERLNAVCCETCSCSGLGDRSVSWRR